jgi:dethiobiotin synthetase
LAGWVANQIDPDMAQLQANLEALHARMPAPCLGMHPYMPTPMAATTWLALPTK